MSLSRLLLSIAIAAVTLACPSAQRRPEGEAKELRAESTEPLLLTASQALEIHVREGKVMEIIPGTQPGESARSRRIETLEDFRTVYAQAAGSPLPPEGPDGALQVNGWSGLECVRAGQACGRPPEGLPQVMVLIRFQ
jgi:hypothetical protein